MLTILGERIRDLREKRKDYVGNNSSVKSAMSQDDLAQEIGITRLSVLNYEKGTRTPDAETLIKIA
jgi:transcriptional regulator with XRE-family HTH domain